jgi:hypothetical protein
MEIQNREASSYSNGWLSRFEITKLESLHLFRMMGFRIPVSLSETLWISKVPEAA